MAWEYKTSTDKIGGSSLYAYVGVNWSVGATKCSYDHMGGVTSPYGGWNNNPQATLYWREWDWGTSSWGVWHQYAQDSAHYSGPGDLPIVQKSDSFARFAYDREVQLDCDVYAVTDTGSGTGSVWMTYTVPALPPAFNTLTATRVSDNQVNLSWTAASGNIKAVCIERSVDGGSYSEVAVIWNASATSWQDNATTADHSYTYRARYHHEGAYGSYSNTVTVTMTPSAPQTISTAAISGSTNVAVTLGNASPVATSLEWQASTDGGQTWGASSTVSGSPVTSFTATGISGTAYIRVRNVNAMGTSDWLVSEQVTTICPPAAPTLISPTGVLDMAGGSVTFTWRHNPLDGSSQTAAQLAYSTNGGSTWTTVTKSTEESHTISPIPWSAGTAVTWRVRTKGADANYGDWAQAVQFDVYTAPILNITSPGATITGMPISLTATYSDMAGFTCQAATVSLQKDGRTLYSEAATVNGTAITASIDVDEFLPTNGESYTIVMTARSSSSLQTTANATFTVDFVPPKAATLQITNDPDTGYASLLVQAAEDEVAEGEVEGFEWNQMNNPTKTESGTKYGVTLTKNADGSYTVSGAATANVNFRFDNTANPSLSSSNKYYFNMCPAGGSTTTFFAYDTWSNAFRDTGEGVITNGKGTLQPVFRIISGTTVNLTFKAALVDLTAIFGAGNEPTTVDAFKATTEYQTMLAKGKLYDYDSGSTQHTMIDLPTQEGDYIHSVAFEGDAKRVVSRNLSPYFSHVFDDKYIADGFPESYWREITTTWITQLADGWAHVQHSNTSGASEFANFFVQQFPKNLKPSTRYTFLVEVRNSSSTSCTIAVSSYNSSLVHAFVSGASTIVTQDGVYRLAVDTIADLSTAQIFSRGYFGLTNGNSINADVRISIYEGDYNGDYEPYVEPFVNTTTGRAGLIAEGYEALEYAYSHRGIPYVKTGIIPSANFGFEVTFLTNSAMSTTFTDSAMATTNFGAIFGGRVASGNKDFQLTTYSPSGYGGDVRIGSDDNDAKLTQGVIQTCSYRNGVYTAPDGSTKSISQSVAGEQEIYLFGLNNNGSNTQYSNTRIYRVAFYDGNTKIADLNPCRRLSDGSIGFYDTVRGLFLNHTYWQLGAGGMLTDLTHQALNLSTNSETYADMLEGNWLAGINDVHDEYADGKITRRIGCVDLGTLTWTANSPLTRFSAYVPNKAYSTELPDGSGKIKGNMICGRYATSIQPSDSLQEQMTVKGHQNTTMVFVKDPNFTDAASFKAAMTGVLLYYELDETQEIELDGTDFQELEVPDTVTLNSYTPSDFTVGYGLGLDEIDKVSVARINPDGTMTPLLTEGQLGAGIVDKYAPLNTPYQYAVTTTAASQAVKTVYVDNELVTDLWFVYWGENIASAKWNPDNGGIQVTRPQKTRVYYAGRRDPVSYDGHAVSLTETPSWMFLGKDEVDTFVGLIEDGGRGVYKSCDGWVYHADFDLTMTPSYTAIGYYGGASLGIIRIAGEKL